MSVLHQMFSWRETAKRTSILRPSGLCSAHWGITHRRAPSGARTRGGPALSAQRRQELQPADGGSGLLAAAWPRLTHRTGYDRDRSGGPRGCKVEGDARHPTPGPGTRLMTPSYPNTPQLIAEVHQALWPEVAELHNQWTAYQQLFLAGDEVLNLLS